MRYINIGSRLRMAASFIDGGKVVCDVGCDHGKLTVYLLQRGLAERVIATDIREKPLMKAVENADRYGVSGRANFLLADGLSGIGKICPEERVSHVVIAGLGGATTANIIKNADFLKTYNIALVLLPAQRGHDLRRFLFENGYRVEREEAVEENGKFYTCMLSRYDGKVLPESLTEIFCGNAINERSPRAAGYLSMVRRRLVKMKDGTENEEGKYSPDEIEKAIFEIDARLSEMSF